MDTSIIIFILIGLILGAIWFLYFERFDNSKLTSDCWQKLHYLHKERAPLYLVHAKSIIAGAVLIVIALSDFKYKDQTIAFIGAAIIGIHICQIVNEMKIIS